MPYLVMNFKNRPNGDLLTVGNHGQFANSYKYEVDWLDEDLIFGTIPLECYDENDSLIISELKQFINTFPDAPVESETKEPELTLVTGDNEENNQGEEE